MKTLPEERVAAHILGSRFPLRHLPLYLTLQVHLIALTESAEERERLEELTKATLEGAAMNAIYLATRKVDGIVSNLKARLTRPRSESVSP